MTQQRLRSSMRAFVAGATGVLGRRLVSELSDRGHQVVGLVRDEAGEQAVRSAGGDPRYGDLLEPDSLPDAVGESDVVVHAATAIPTDTNPDREDWALNDRIRREGTRTLTDLAAAGECERFLQASVTWIAQRDDGTPFDETVDPDPHWTVASAVDAERIVREAAEENGFDPVICRCGWFYAHDATHTRQIGEGLLSRSMPVIAPGILGRGDATFSVLHVDDAATAFAAAAEGDAAGTFHVVDDEPVAWADFFRAFADRLGAPTPFRIPGWVAGLFVGDGAVEMFTNSALTTNDRFRETFDWEPAFPTYREGLDQVVEEWIASGRLREAGDGYEWTDPEERADQRASTASGGD